MTGRTASLLRQGDYCLAWVKDFYDQTRTGWGPNTDWASRRSRAAALARPAGPGPKRVLDLGAAPGGDAAAVADPGCDVTAVERSDRAVHARELAKAARMSYEWLAPHGCVLMDVYPPARPARDGSASRAGRAG